jgi:hypothetical protein
MLNLFAKRAVDKNVLPDHSIVNPTWEQTPENSPIRRIVVEIWAAQPITFLAERFAGPDKNVPKSFIVNCLQRVADTRARAVENPAVEERKLVIDRSRDEVLKDFIA